MWASDWPVKPSSQVLFYWDAGIVRTRYQRMPGMRQRPEQLPPNPLKAAVSRVKLRLSPIRTIINTYVYRQGQYFPFYLAIIVLNAMEYLIMGPKAKDRPVTMATVKAIGFLFSRIMNFSPLRVTPLSASSIKLKSTRPWNPSSPPHNLPNKRRRRRKKPRGNVHGATNLGRGRVSDNR